MKKNIITGIVLLSTLLGQFSFAKSIEKDLSNDEIVPPKWEDYVHEKYYNPRTDFKRKTAYFEMACGFVLTDFLITAPIGIPLIYHSATKVKNISYGERKAQFEQGLKVAETITDKELKKAYYKTLIKDCKLSERKKKKLAKKRAKQIKKAEEKRLKQIRRENNNTDNNASDRSE